MGLQWMDLPCESIHDLAVDGACIRSNANAIHVHLGRHYIIPDCMRLCGHGGRCIQDRQCPMGPSPYTCACMERSHRIDHIVHVFYQRGGRWVGRSMDEHWHKHSVTTRSVVFCTRIFTASSFSHCLYVPLPAPTRQNNARHAFGQNVICTVSYPPITFAAARSVTRQFTGRSEATVSRSTSIEQRNTCKLYLLGRFCIML